MPYNIHVSKEDGTLRVAWDNRRVPKDNVTFLFLALFWAFWAPMTIVATWLLWRGTDRPFLLVLAWCVLGWVGTFGIPVAMLGRWRSEWIEVSPAGIVHGFAGLLALGPHTYAFGPGMEIAFGQMLTPSSTRPGRMIREGNVTLSLFWTSTLGIRRRALLAYWLAPKVKEQVFLAIKAYVETQHLPMVVRRQP